MNVIIRKRRPNLNFREMGVPVGAKLVFHDDESVIVEVIDDRKVRMGNGEEVFLTPATQSVLKTETSVHPTRYWLFEGRPLSDMYNETYGT